MKDESLIQMLRDSRAANGPIALAQLLERGVGHALTDAAFISYFKRAFPEIPLTTLSEASRWHRLGMGSVDDNSFQELLKAWLPGRAQAMDKKSEKTPDSELYSKLFVQYRASRLGLLEIVTSVTDGTVNVSWTVTAGAFELDIRPNENVVDEPEEAGASDFIYYPFTVEVTADNTVVETGRYVEFVSALMRALNANGMSVVAACDWEGDLPGGGRLGSP